MPQRARETKSCPSPMSQHRHPTDHDPPASAHLRDPRFATVDLHVKIGASGGPPRRLRFDKVGRALEDLGFVAPRRTRAPSLATNGRSPAGRTTPEAPRGAISRSPTSARRTDARPPKLQPYYVHAFSSSEGLPRCSAQRVDHTALLECTDDISVAHPSFREARRVLQLNS